MSRRELIMIITKRLVLLTAAAILVVGGVFALPLFIGSRIMVSWLCLLCGIIGGFVSIQQRLKGISDEELRLLSGSWYQTLLIPIYGGVFAFVLYLIFLSNFITSPMFPSFKYPDVPSFGLNYVYFVAFIRETVPKDGPDFAKLLFWCFVAGFSERFVPQIIGDLEGRVRKVSGGSDDSAGNGSGTADKEP